MLRVVAAVGTILMLAQAAPPPLRVAVNMTTVESAPLKVPPAGRWR
jgi:hypothetical protein